MQAQNFMRVEEVAQELGISKSHAYKVIHKLNAELRDKGYLTISGRVNRNFFMEKFCYGKTGKEGYRGPSRPREHRHHLQLCAPVSVQAGGNGR